MNKNIAPKPINSFEKLNGQLNFFRSLNLLLAREIRFLEEFESRLGNCLFDEEVIDFYDELERFEVNLIRVALIKSGGSQREAARLLSMNYQTIHAKIKRFKIEL